MQFSSKLENANWEVFASPFRHYRASNVLPKQTYEAIARNFQTLLPSDGNWRDASFDVWKKQAAYDARMLSITSESCGNFFPFFSREWIEGLYESLGLPFSTRISGALHSSPAKSRTGWIHHDFCSGWFDESLPAGGELFFPRHDRCEYFSGTPKVAGAKPQEYVRAATMIFYLCNDGWKEGDGGETGLYGASRATPHTVSASVPPVNNSLFVFECSPHSYHRFLTNPGRARNSIILWLHCSVEDAVKRWGNTVIRRRPS